MTTKIDRDANTNNWCLSWRTPIMRASAFWYFETEDEAKEQAKQFQPDTVWSIHPVDRDVNLSHGFAAGNYGNAYETQDLTAGLAQHSDRSEAFRHAYTLGFFSSYELDEIPSDARDQFDDAYTSENGQRVLALGYTDTREQE